VTKLRENQHMSWENSNGMIGADLGTLTAVVALFLVYLRNRNADCFAYSDYRL
jgi:hypothetical protein